MQSQHHDVTAFSPPSLYSPSPLRHGPREHRMEWLDRGLDQRCLVPSCQYRNAIKDQMRMHWCSRHYDDFFQFEGETGDDKCDRCMKYIRTRRLAMHQRTKLCRIGNTRRESRAKAAAASLPAPKFYVGGNEVEQVTKFRYLSRILSEDDQDLSACVFATSNVPG
jgi:hypothetical protein